MVNRYLIILPLCLFIALFIGLLNAQIPTQFNVWDLFLATENLDLLLVQNYSLPRIAMAILAGGVLGFASLLLQQVMANPLASDSTLGINSGAQFALFLCTIFVPDWLDNGESLIAICGAALSLVLVLTLAMRKSMSPLILILAGLVVNLYFGSFSALMMLFYPEESRGLAQWGAGSLVQESWCDTISLIKHAVPAFVIIAMLIRPLSILSLNDANANSLGVPVGKLRVISVLISAFLIATVVSMVGMLGFVGLAAATIIRQMRVRTLKGQLLGAFLIGALLLSITDLCLQLLAHFKNINLPTGAVTSVLGTPLLLWLMFRALPHSGRLQETESAKFYQFRPHFTWLTLISLIVVIFISLFIGQGNQGWYVLNPDSWQCPILVLRAPRILTALSVGMLLAIAGVILQRLTQNPMASPELLGVSSGTSMGILAALFLFSVQSNQWFWIAGIIGALIALFILATINQRNGMLPEKILLTGISLSALFDTLQRIAIASGDPRANQLIAWTSSSTQYIPADFALYFIFASILLVGISLIFSRWLDILLLQAPIAQALGLNLKHTRWVLIIFAAILTALATLLIGPLSFIGLLVPQITTFLGVKKARNQLLLSATLGALIMVLADWLGRQMIFPYEVPAGLVATLIGGTYFLFMVRRV